MLKPSHRHSPLALLAAASIALGLSACGSEDSKTVATVGKTKISQATLSHWMGTTLGSDYQAAVGKQAPLGLVSDPPDYARCVSVAERVVPEVPSKPKLSASQLRGKCKQLNTAIREQALTYVISVLWRIQEGAELGIKLDPREITREIQRISYEEYRSPAQFRRYLASNRRSLADERFLLTRNLLDRKFRDRLKQRAGGFTSVNLKLAKLVNDTNAKLRAKTSCSPGYLAWQCKEYGSLPGASPSAAVVIEYLTKGKA